LLVDALVLKLPLRLELCDTEVEVDRLLDRETLRLELRDKETLELRELLWDEERDDDPLRLDEPLVLSDGTLDKEDEPLLEKLTLPLREEL
jgi:hypothetical protein